MRVVYVPDCCCRPRQGLAPRQSFAKMSCLAAKQRCRRLERWNCIFDGTLLPPHSPRGFCKDASLSKLVALHEPGDYFHVAVPA